jgi:hypothetical protein
MVYVNESTGNDKLKMTIENVGICRKTDVLLNHDTIVIVFDKFFSAE